MAGEVAGPRVVDFESKDMVKIDLGLEKQERC